MPPFAAPRATDDAPPRRYPSRRRALTPRWRVAQADITAAMAKRAAKAHGSADAVQPSIEHGVFLFVCWSGAVHPTAKKGAISLHVTTEASSLVVSFPLPRRRLTVTLETVPSHCSKRDCIGAVANCCVPRCHSATSWKARARSGTCGDFPLSTYGRFYAFAITLHGQRRVLFRTYFDVGEPLLFDVRRIVPASNLHARSRVNNPSAFAAIRVGRP
jgi:hypothetical protein